MISDILYDMNLFVDGRGFAGRVNELTLPKLAPILQEYRAGGMSAPIDVPMGSHEKLEMELTLNGFDGHILKLFKVHLGSLVPFTARGVTADDDGAKHSMVVTMRGLIKEHDFGAWKSGEEAQLKLGLSLRYYKLERDGAVLVESDPVNRVLVVDGQDQHAETRKALGL